MLKIGWLWVARNRSLKVTGNSTIRYSAYEFLLGFHSNYVPTLHLHRTWDIARYWSKIAVLTHHTCIWRPMEVTPLEFRRDLYGQKATEPLGYLTQRCFRDMFSHSAGTIPAFYGRTDRRSDNCLPSVENDRRTAMFCRCVVSWLAVLFWR